MRPPTPAALPEDRAGQFQEGESLWRYRCNCDPPGRFAARSYRCPGRVAQRFEREHRQICKAEDHRDRQGDRNPDCGTHGESPFASQPVSVAISHECQSRLEGDHEQRSSDGYSVATTERFTWRRKNRRTSRSAARSSRGAGGGVETARPVIEQRRRGYVPRATATMPRWWMNRFAAVNAEAARGGTGGRRLTPARRSRGSPPVLRSNING